MSAVALPHMPSSSTKKAPYSYKPAPASTVSSSSSSSSNSFTRAPLGVEIVPLHNAESLVNGYPALSKVEIEGFVKIQNNTSEIVSIHHVDIRFDAWTFAQFGHEGKLSQDFQYHIPLLTDIQILVSPASNDILELKPQTVSSFPFSFKIDADVAASLKPSTEFYRPSGVSAAVRYKLTATIRDQSPNPTIKPFVFRFPFFDRSAIAQVARGDKQRMKLVTKDGVLVSISHPSFLIPGGDFSVDCIISTPPTFSKSSLEYLKVDIIEHVQMEVEGSSRSRSDVVMSKLLPLTQVGMSELGVNDHVPAPQWPQRYPNGINPTGSSELLDVTHNIAVTLILKNNNYRSLYEAPLLVIGATPALIKRLFREAPTLVSKSPEQDFGMVSQVCLLDGVEVIPDAAPHTLSFNNRDTSLSLLEELLSATFIQEPDTSCAYELHPAANVAQEPSRSPNGVGSSSRLDEDGAASLPATLRRSDRDSSKGSDRDSALSAFADTFPNRSLTNRRTMTSINSSLRQSFTSPYLRDASTASPSLKTPRLELSSLNHRLSIPDFSNNVDVQFDEDNLKPVADGAKAIKVELPHIDTSNLLDENFRLSTILAADSKPVSPPLPESQNQTPALAQQIADPQDPRDEHHSLSCTQDPSTDNFAEPALSEPVSSTAAATGTATAPATTVAAPASATQAAPRSAEASGSLLGATAVTASPSDPPVSAEQSSADSEFPQRTYSRQAHRDDIPPPLPHSAAAHLGQSFPERTLSISNNIGGVASSGHAQIMGAGKDPKAPADPSLSSALSSASASAGPGSAGPVPVMKMYSSPHVPPVPTHLIRSFGALSTHRQFMDPASGGSNPDALKRTVGASESGQPQMQPMIPALVRHPVPHGTAHVSPENLANLERAFVIFSFFPMRPDELELRSSDTVVIRMTFTDGWGEGTNLNTGRSGIFPLNAVRLFAPGTAGTAAANPYGGFPIAQQSHHLGAGAGIHHPPRVTPIQTDVLSSRAAASELGSIVSSASSKDHRAVRSTTPPASPGRQGAFLSSPSHVDPSIPARQVPLQNDILIRRAETPDPFASGRIDFNGSQANPPRKESMIPAHPGAGPTDQRTNMSASIGHIHSLGHALHRGPSPVPSSTQGLYSSITPQRTNSMKKRHQGDVLLQSGHVPDMPAVHTGASSSVSSSSSLAIPEDELDRRLENGSISIQDYLKIKRGGRA
ncbi:uncharacterized protein BJ171DRAFT_309705 [Polychytrium aggregatum]|uniref:uncharacterized protein n=1 Tax=Polychytrium aggregatum TaxID=110093 RepID=UPI0022FE288C|nr:uncharacterized protein BJ171DRAFT_309705 [Polychytrium aggregatum]KAI9206977.1 hypothetical protein BJ171DRAFT_309705 [Polychytrium aggregatum]